MERKFVVSQCALPGQCRKIRQRPKRLSGASRKDSKTRPASAPGLATATGPCNRWLASPQEVTAAISENTPRPRNTAAHPGPPCGESK